MPDLLPPAYIERLSTLQDRVPPLPWSTVQARLVQELGRPLDQVFSRVDQAPVAGLTASPTSGVAPLPVHFDASTSFDPDAAAGDAVASYTYTFGDGTAPVRNTAGALPAHPATASETAPASADTRTETPAQRPTIIGRYRRPDGSRRLKRRRPRQHPRYRV